MCHFGKLWRFCRSLALRGLALTVQVLCLSWAAGLLPAGAGELSEHRLKVGGESRSYLMLQPQGGAGPRPVVIALHGAGQSAEGFRGYFGLDQTARANDFVVVYPQGGGRVWNDGRPAAMRLTGVLRPGDDVPFLVTLAQRLVKEGIADPSRIYLAGISNGGFMVERMACEFAHVFAAYTVIMATAPATYRKTCHPSRPVPIMFIHGTADSVIAYSGFWTPLGATLSAPDSAALFARLNGCGASTRRSLPNRDKWDGTSVTERSWGACRGGSKVRFLTVERGGHQSPARVDTDMAAATPFLGLRNRDIDAGEEAWRFMSAFSLPRPKPEGGERPVAASPLAVPLQSTPEAPSAYAPQTDGRAGQMSGGEAGGSSLW
ncbi:alpha/beta hydrolase family esterase [Xanthobacter sp. TB0139]|uniref:alpha/beta hydrolase family esterase n=1 Tax=Xanthobacter sp. TB0139 TaxID=3459178 RepID=UPI004039DD27